MLVSRSEASETLSSLLGLEAMETEEEFEFPLPPALLLTGAPRSGKSTLVSSVLDGAKDDSVRVAVASCQQGSVHPKYEDQWAHLCLRQETNSGIFSF